MHHASGTGWNPHIPDPLACTPHNAHTNSSQRMIMRPSMVCRPILLALSPTVHQAIPGKAAYLSPTARAIIQRRVVHSSPGPLALCVGVETATDTCDAHAKSPLQLAPDQGHAASWNAFMHSWGKGDGGRRLVGRMLPPTASGAFASLGSLWPPGLFAWWSRDERDGQSLDGNRQLGLVSCRYRNLAAPTAKCLAEAMATEYLGSSR